MASAITPDAINTIRCKDSRVFFRW